jgi:hypothetical protein
MDTRLPIYYGQYAVGKLLNYLPVDMNVSFLWFNYIAFVLIIWAIGISTSLAVNYLSGIIASILVSFGYFSQVMNLFVSGAIFDIMGIGLFLPLALLCLSRKGLGWKIGALVSLMMFGFWHANGKYVLALLPIMVLYELTRGVISRNILDVLSDIWKNRFLMYMCGLILALSVGFIINIAGFNSGRLMADASVLLMVVVAGVLSLVFVRDKALVIISIIISVLVATPSMYVWFHNNNAIKDVDKEAITYLNSLSGATYITSVEIAQDIYDLFVNKQFVKEYDKADYIVMRSTPMTFRSDPNGIWFENQDRLALPVYLANNEYSLLKEFDRGELNNIIEKGQPVIIDVYAKGDKEL